MHALRSRRRSADDAACWASSTSDQSTECGPRAHTLDSDESPDGVGGKRAFTTGSPPVELSFSRPAVFGKAASGLRRSFPGLRLEVPKPAAGAQSIRQVLLDGGYRPGAVIGRSDNRSFTVLAAEDGQRQLAVKCCDERQQEGVLGMALRREYEILCGLSHPCIVEPVQFVEASVGSAMVMELCAGVCLQTVLPVDSGLCAAKRHTVLRGILDAVVYMHRRRVAHRDLHSQNLLVDPRAPQTGSVPVKLVDFGSACQLQADEVLLATGLEDAEQQIMPPFFAGVSDVFACDVFAVGLLAAGLAAGRPLFTADVVQCGKLSIPQGCICLSEEGTHHVLSLLAPAPEDRSSADDALRTLPGTLAWARSRAG